MYNSNYAMRLLRQRSVRFGEVVFVIQQYFFLILGIQRSCFSAGFAMHNCFFKAVNFFI